MLLLEKYKRELFINNFFRIRNNLKNTSKSLKQNYIRIIIILHICRVIIEDKIYLELKLNQNYNTFQTHYIRQCGEGSCIRYKNLFIYFIKYFFKSTLSY